MASGVTTASTKSTPANSAADDMRELTPRAIVIGVVGGLVVGITSVSDGSGYWMTASVGAVLPFGDAGFYGSPAGSP